MEHRMKRFLFASLSRLGQMALRVVITCLIFSVCLTVMSRYLGLPVPGPLELLDKFKDVSRLADILS
jgi:hypothetical protein